MRALGFRNICFGGSTRKTQGGFNGYSQGMSRHVSGELFLKGSFSVCDDSNRDEREREKGDEEGERGRESGRMERGSVLARLSAFRRFEEERKR